MESAKVRKSWFSASPTVVHLTPTKLAVASDFDLSSTVKTARQTSELNCQLVLSTSDENHEPMTVTASDVLTLNTFSRRAVVDFGTINYCRDRPVVRYLLLENPLEEDQLVTIQRGLPMEEFSVDWIGSGLLQAPTLALAYTAHQTPYAICRDSQSQPSTLSRCVRGPNGRFLLRITWHPPSHSVPGPPCLPAERSVHHILQFRVNRSYPLQALIVGKLVYSAIDKCGESKRVHHALICVLSQKPTAPRHPVLQLKITYSARSWTYFRSSKPFKPNRQQWSSVSDRDRTTKSAFVNEGVPLLRSISALKHTRSSSQPPTHRITTVASMPKPDSVCGPNQLSPIPHTPQSHDPLIAPRRSRSVAADCETPSVIPADRTRSTNTPDLYFVNAAAIGFLSPKLIRSPALKRDPQADTTCLSYSLTSLNRQRCGNLFYPELTHSLSELSERGLTQWLNSVFAPCIAANSAMNIPDTSNGMRYPSTVSYAAVLDKAMRLLHTSAVIGPGQRLEREVDEGKILPTPELCFRVDRDAVSRASNGADSVCAYLISVRRLSTFESHGPPMFLTSSGPRFGSPHPSVPSQSVVSAAGVDRRETCLLCDRQMWRVKAGVSISALKHTRSSSQPPTHRITTVASMPKPDSVCGPNQLSPIPHTPQSHDPLIAPRRSRSVAADCETPSVIPADRTRSTNTPDLYFVNAAAIGFLSPKLIRSPALKRDPQADTTCLSYSLTSLNRQRCGNLFYPELTHSLSELSERGLTQWLNSVFAPCIAANSAMNIPDTSNGMRYPSTVSYAAVLDKAMRLLHTSAVIGPGQRLEREVDEGKILPMPELCFRVDRDTFFKRVTFRKLAELLLPFMPKPKQLGFHRSADVAPTSLMSLIRFPAISRLQKIHNVGLALKAFEQYGRLCLADGSEIDPRDIVDGHREKSLTLLWCLLLRYQVLALVDLRLLSEEIDRLRLQHGCVATGDVAHLDNKDEDEPADDVVHVKLLTWACLVCNFYGIKIDNLDESFSDGRALCMLLHHYLPTVMPRGLVRQVTTITASTKYRSCALANSHLARNNHYNLCLFQRKLSYLGDVPVLLEPCGVFDPSRITGLLPPGLILATLAYLASRLVLIPMGREKLTALVADHAARILQTAWRSRQQRMQAKQLRLLSPRQPKPPS
ncbi:hypothetical protein AHF37_02330 [Paragonimus kellicotti]|nr:hypothetical protein AHF37_02330 [Paragonimus kellicotti]